MKEVKMTQAQAEKAMKAVSVLGVAKVFMAVALVCSIAMGDGIKTRKVVHPDTPYGEML
jgi:hypothetical protein